MKENFVESLACKSRAHCNKCRSKVGHRHWREGLKKHFELPENEVDFACPFGAKWREQALTGAGDIVAKLTKAVGIEPCAGCEQRQTALNKRFPLGKS